MTDYLGKDEINRIYDYADVFHCEPIEKVADEFIQENEISYGTFDNVKECKYAVPDLGGISFLDRCSYIGL